MFHMLHLQIEEEVGAALPEQVQRGRPNRRQLVSVSGKGFFRVYNRLKELYTNLSESYRLVTCFQCKFLLYMKLNAASKKYQKLVGECLPQYAWIIKITNPACYEITCLALTKP